VEVEAWAYDLRPGLPPEGIPREEVHRHYRPEYLDYVLQSAARAGIDMRFPSVIANTGKAHEASELARDQGLLLPFQRAVFRACWEEGQNIGEVEVLCRLAGECDLDAADVRQALADGRYRQRVEEQQQWARQAGVNGVPTFIFNEKFAMEGAQEYEIFRDVAQRILAGRLRD
jgi:predicted DsbA family dithiol-disulfide isomerase